jgi:hypothetical protein
MPKKSSVKKRGGYWGLGSVINTAIVPGSLLALQQSYGKRKKTAGRRSKRRGTKRRSRRSH